MVLPNIISTTSEVDAQLLALGLDQSILHQVVFEAYHARASATPNHPPLHASFNAWSESVRSLRDLLIPKGWHRCNANNWPRTIHPLRVLAITVASGDINTGIANANPMTSSSKGPRTLEAVEINQNMYLPGFEPNPQGDFDNAESNIPTYLLLIHQTAEELRCELSLPINSACNGQVNDWKTRIILTPILLAPIEVEPINPPILPDIDLDIRRKA